MSVIVLSSEQTEGVLEVLEVRVAAAAESYPLENQLVGSAEKRMGHLESQFVVAAVAAGAAGIVEDVGQENPFAAEGYLLLRRNSGVVVETAAVVETGVAAAVAAETGLVVGIGLVAGTVD